MDFTKSFSKASTLILVLCYFAGGGSLCHAQAATDAALQNSPGPLVATTDMQSTTQTPSANSSTDKASEDESKKKDEKKHKRKLNPNGAFVIAPLPMVSPAIGAGVVPIIGYITPIPITDRALTPSVIGVGGLITNNGSRAYVLGTDLYIDKARYELETGYAHGSLDYNLYGIGSENGNAGLKLPLEQAGYVFFIKAMRRIHWGFYGGMRFTDGSSFITLKPSGGNIPPIPPDVGLHTNLRALGMEIWRDSRPNKFYPVKGSVIDFTGDFFAQDLGSKYSFQSYKVTFDKYFSLSHGSDKQVLAYNLFWCGTGGSPPFYGNCIYGTNNELRGYTAGRYLDRFMFATQLEYRLALPWRFGVVGFGGLGSVTPGADQLFRSHEFLPAGGTGIRYMLSKSYHVNLRTDFAWGKNNFTWAVGVGEAF